MESEDLHRLLLTVHYDGSGFHGWQYQPDVRTVQGEVEAVLERISGRRRALLGSGRTDTGVHATGQVAAVDLPVRWTPHRLRRALNGLLGDDVWIESVRVVPAAFHPRFDAVMRSYRYRVGLAPRAASPFHRRWCWPLEEALDRDRLDRAAAALRGEHSFRAFAKAGQEERGDRCTVHAAAWEPWSDLGLAFTITANRFLHHMVRYLVGTLVAVGAGRRPDADVEALLRGADPECVTSPPAPPQGLFLERVEYPDHAFEPRPPSHA
ncbi:MAG: tRNA pseudouridine(38-40) synthase TruA [Longimicrobiales bacterium]|nr:tRNA pseudouridine(38-40) synthase TruA [Longimicrobiales bacterium]